MDGYELPEGVAVRDPHPTAREAPYTYFLPDPQELAALRPGDWIKVVFDQTEDEAECPAERMWIRIEAIAGGEVFGRLDNLPEEISRLKRGDPVRAPICHAIDIDFGADHVPPSVPPRREYWDRCLVDRCVLDGTSPVDYLYREAPDATRQADEFPDSGWCLRGTEQAVARDEARGARPCYVALGAVLNRDDRWLPLIDREVGSVFQWSEAAGAFVEVD